MVLETGWQKVVALAIVLSFIAVVAVAALILVAARRMNKWTA